MFNIRGEERGFLLWRDAILQVRFIVAHNAGVYILRVERENSFTLIGLCCYTECCEQKQYDFRNALQRTFLNLY